MDDGEGILEDCNDRIFQVKCNIDRYRVQSKSFVKLGFRSGVFQISLER